MKQPKRRYDYFPDLPDKRDHYYAPRPTLLDFPPLVNMAADVTRIEDQGNLGSCVAHGVTSVCEALDFRNDRRYLNRSRLFVYYNGRVLDDTVNEDSGLYIRDGIKAVAQQGVPSETYWPYKIGSYRQKPPAKAYANAATHLVTEYQRVDQTRGRLLAALAEGHFVVFGFSVYDSFESRAAQETGIVPLPNLARESLLGGHCMVACGYDIGDPRNETVLTVNSWGTGVGLKPKNARSRGFFLFPLAYLLDGDLAEDFWIVRGIQGVK